MKKILKDYIEFYKKNLKKKHIVCTIISMLIFVIFLVSSIMDYSSVEGINYTKTAYSNTFQENALLCSIVALFIAIAYSLCIATGIHYCVLSAKKFNYSQKKGFKFNDFKMAIYKLRKEEKKLEELEKKNKIEMEKAEKLNVKVPYIKYVISFAISFIILTLTSIVIR